MNGADDRFGEILVTTAWNRLAKRGFDTPEQMRPQLVAVFMSHGHKRLPSHADIVQQQLIVARQADRVEELREQTKPSVWARVINQEAVAAARYDLEDARLSRRAMIPRGVWRLRA